MNLTLEQLISLYAPLGGLIALAFYTGVLSNRVRQLEATNKERTDLKPEFAALKAVVDAMGNRLVELKADNHEAFREINHILRNRMMIQTALEGRHEQA